MGNDGGDTRESRVALGKRESRVALEGRESRVVVARRESPMESMKHTSRLQSVMRFGTGWIGPVAIAMLLALPSGAAEREPERPKKAGKGGAHGAIAYNQKSGAYGFSYDYPVARAAKESALARCGEPGCIVIVNFRNACAALVQGPKRPFVSQGITQDEASTRAMNKCGDETRCKPVAWACTR